MVESRGDIAQKIEQATALNVINDGKLIVITPTDGAFGEITAVWKNTIEGSYEMPAYGVSLNDLTVEAMQKGVWLEFCFGKTMESGGMPFEKLAVNVRPEFCGFNLIRYNSDVGYDGRCFYINLANDMSALYNLLLSI